MTSIPTTLPIAPWRDTPSYSQAVKHMQRGEWSQAMAIFTQLRKDYPDDHELHDLYDEAQLRLDLEPARQSRGGIGRMLPGRRAIFVGVMVILALAMMVTAVRAYNLLIVPAMARSNRDAQVKVLVTAAEKALSEGDYDRSLAIYNQVAQVYPGYPGLAQGRADANKAKMADDAYTLAAAQLAAGNLTDAQSTLVSIQQAIPNYRDVNVLLGRIERQQRVNNLLRQVSDAVAARNWDQVVSRLEEAYSLLPPESRGSVEADLFDAYLNLGQQVVDGSGGRPLEVQRAADLYGKALALHPQQTQATQARNLALAYLDGYKAVKDNNWNAAILALEPLYAAMPNYLGGEATRVLYNAYMRSGDQSFGDGQLQMAWQRYYQASTLQGVDTSTARALAANLQGRIAPTPTPRPAVAAGTPLPLAARVAGGTPEPGTLPLARLTGKIVFTSSRGGAPALWVMDVDGKNPFMLKDQVAAQKDYAALRAAEARSPDGKRTVFVTMPPNETYPQLFAAEADGTATRLSDLAGLNADPVWSPTGHWIAFVSNQPGNDEIFVIGADGKNLKRLTNNTFEWDKHPSWSPDGRRLIWWSNQGTGHPQIWVMNEDGSGATNLSNNKYDDSDPIWIK
ncbi:MAG TPA: hypothetical protein VGA61_06915 [Anaerolineae bacterium]